MQEPMLNIAVRAARKAGQVLMKGYDDPAIRKIELKQAGDYVSDIDYLSEHTIIQMLQQHYPQHGILAEESGEHIAGRSDYCWIIDPLDGTNNYLRGLGQFCVSIALQYKGKIVQAVIYDPLNNDLYTATRGRGATLNDRRLRINFNLELNNAVLATGVPFKFIEQKKMYATQLDKILPLCIDIRCVGSAALSMAYVAAGKLDGYWETGVSVWDIAAGSLLVQEAGGLVTDYRNGNDFLPAGQIIAAASKVHTKLQSLIHQSQHQTA